MMKLRKLIIFSVIIFLIASYGLLYSQSKELEFEDETTVLLSDFDRMEINKRYKWTASNGREYGALNTGDKKGTFIKLNGEWVKHGIVYYYSKDILGEEKIEYLREKTEFQFGVKQGQSELYSIINGKPYLSEVTNYKNGYKHGKHYRLDSEKRFIETGEYDYNFKIGTWRSYFTFSKSLMYEYQYENYCSCKRYGYELDNIAAKNNKKGRLKSIQEYKVKITNFELLTSYIVAHGNYTYFDSNGKSTIKYKSKDGIGKIIEDCKYAVKLKNLIADPNLADKENAKKIFQLLFPNLNLTSLGEISKEDTELANNLFKVVMSQTCVMKYVKTLAESALTPTRTLNGILEALIESKLEGCTKKDITQIMTTYVGWQYMGELRVRLGVQKD